MKKIVLALGLTFLCATSQLRAQEVTLEGLTAQGFSGVKSFNGEYYYTVYFAEKTENKMANFWLSIYDKDLNLLKKGMIELSKRSKLYASGFNGKNFLFVFADLSKKTRTTVCMDLQGNELKRQEETDVRAALLTPDNAPVILADGDGFVMVRPEKDKKFGYEVSRIDASLTPAYNNGFFPEKGKWIIVDAEVRNGRLFLLRDETGSIMTRDFVNTVQCIDIRSGKTIYATELTNDGDAAYSSFVNPADDGGVAVGGVYFKNGKMDEKNSDGLYLSRIAADGSFTSVSKVPWSVLKDKYNGEFSLGIIGGKTKVLVEDVIALPDGTFQVIGETYRKSNNADNTGEGMLRYAALGSSGGSSSSRDAGFTVQDFLFFNFSADGQFQNMVRVDKQSREAVIEGEHASDKGFAMARWLQKEKRFFCYRGTVTHEGKQYIYYVNDDGYKDRAYFIPVGATTVEGAPSIDMDKWMSEGVSNMGKLAKLTNGNKHTFRSYTSLGELPSEYYKGIVVGKPGYMMSYGFDYRKMKLMLWLEPIPVH